MMSCKWLLCVTLVAVLLAGCGGAPTPTPVALRIPWGQGDQAQYELQAGGKTIGSFTMTTSSSDSGYTFLIKTVAPPITDTSQVTVDKNLRPLATQRELQGSPQSDFALKTEYRSGKLYIQARTAAGDKSATINVPANVWDNDQVLASIRALPLTDNYEYSFVTIVGASAQTLQTTVKVVGREEVTAPAGVFDAYKVELRFAQGTHLAWYDTKAPYHMIKYENTDAKTTIVLVKAG